MQKMQVIVEQCEPYRERYALWSVLYVKIDETCFPYESWLDATSAVLCIWLENMNKLLSGLRESVSLPFMDDDYSFSLTRSAHNCAVVRCYGPKNITVLEQEIDIFYFGRQLLSAVGKIEKYYVANLNTPQLKELSNLADKFRVTLKERLDGKTIMRK